jgi:hypothetical protein
MKDRGSRFQVFFVHQEQIYPRSKLSELINTECLSMEAPLLLSKLFEANSSAINEVTRIRPSEVEIGASSRHESSTSFVSCCPRSGIFQEKISGSNRNRPELRRVLDHIREGDIIVVWKIDRLARSTRDLLETMETIREAGAGFQSISEPWADTTSHSGKMIMTIFTGIAEFERDLIRERTGQEARCPV